MAARCPQAFCDCHDVLRHDCPRIDNFSHYLAMASFHNDIAHLKLRDAAGRVIPPTQPTPSDEEDASAALTPITPNSHSADEDEKPTPTSIISDADRDTVESGFHLARKRILDLVENSDEPRVTWGEKQPRPSAFDSSHAMIDLDEYFAQFDMTNVDKISICRTYANHLAQVERISKKQRQ